MKPILLVSMCAMFLGMVAGRPLTPQDSCEDLANYIQQSSRLPDKPGEDGVVSKVSGSTAKKMFPGQSDNLSIFKSYSYVAYFNTCRLAPAYTQVQVKSGPYKEEKTTKVAYDLGLQVGVDLPLATIYKYLPSITAKAGISRGYESVVSAGVEIKDGELKQECVITPGWFCTAYIRLDEFDSGKIIVDDRIRQEVFFPASLNGVNLYSDVWLGLPSSFKARRQALEEWLA